MSAQRKINIRRKRRALRVRRAIRAQTTLSGRLRLAVFRSLKYIYAQAIDDVAGQTVASASSREYAGSMSKLEAAGAVGKALAAKLKEANINEVVFDRSRYLYHGRVKALAEALRDGGLQF